MDRSLLSPAPTSRSRGSFLFLVAAAVVMASTSFADPHLPKPIYRGSWTPCTTWTHTAVHMALLRGDSLFHSKVLWWEGGEDAPQQMFAGGLWGWRDSSYNCSGYPASTFTPLLLGSPPDNLNLFCAGNAHMSDGRLFIAGGTDPGENGIKSGVIFDASADTAHQWTRRQDMSYRRWYPTATELPDGRMLVSSGSQYYHLWVFGGRDGSNQLHSDVSRFATTKAGQWDPAKQGIPGPNWPDAREGHAVTQQAAYSSMFVFGGVKADGNYLNDTWQFYQDNAFSSSDYSYAWNQRLTTSTPPGRAWHSAVRMTGDTTVVFGGVLRNGSSDVPLDEVWWLRFDTTSVSWNWKQLFPTGNQAPGALQGHAAVWDDARRRILIFGGASSPYGAPIDTSVWALSFLTDPVHPSWSKPLMRNPLSHPLPRVGHSLAWDPFIRQRTGHIAENRAVLFGGKGSFGSDTLANDLWTLWVGDTLEWEPLSPGGTPPAKRWRQSATFDVSTSRLVLIGGRTASSVTDTSVWSVNLDYVNQGAGFSPQWTQFTGEQGVGAPKIGRSGQIAFFDQSPYFARVPEIFDNTTNTWSALSTIPRLQEWFPFMFVRPSGTLFFAGPTDSTYLFTASPPAWSFLPSTKSGFKGGSAVMYRPDSVMKCGSRDTDNILGPTDGTTAKIDLTAGTPTWTTQTANLMMGRVNHNLVLLPTGEVMVVGGLGGFGDNQSNSPRYRPEIWAPDWNNGMGAWYGNVDPDTLASSPARRGYHSTALLLPDGRILSAGGNDGNVDQLKANIYCPPYLFNADGTLATRPTTSGVTATLKYGQTFTVCTTDSVAKVVLIRPGAVTHGYDEDQRYLTLGFNAYTSPPRVVATAPSNANLATPGNYLLFLLNTHGVPSVARWVRVQSGTAYDDCDSVPAAIVTNWSAIALQPPCDLQEGWVKLKWTAPADDSTFAPTGRASLYQARYSTSPITNANWSGATGISPDPPSPGAPGTLDSVIVTGLLPSQRYYFRMRTKDDKSSTDTWSGLSNEISTVTKPPCLGGGFAGGGGGGGGGLRTDPQFTSFATTGSGAQQTTADVTPENSLFDGAAAGVQVEDMLKLPALDPTAPDAHVWIRSGTRRAAIDAARLLAVDHEAGVRAFVVNGGVVLGNPVPPTRATSGQADVTALLNGGDAGPFIGEPGNSVTVDLGADTTGSGLVVLDVGNVGVLGAPESSGVLVQVPDGAGWRTVGQAYGRTGYAESAYQCGGADRLRLVFLSRLRLDFAGRLVLAAEQPTLQWATLTSARDGKLGDVSAAIARVDSVTANMAGADTVQLTFSPPALAPGKVREWFLVASASVAELSQAALVRLGQSASPLPTRFALAQNQPNPFGGVTTIRFELPVGASVRLEIFDTQGRRARVLANRFMPAGYQSVTWDGRDDQAHQVGPGVYFYRMEAASFRDRKKMVLLP